MIWIIYVITDNHTLAWIAFLALLLVAALGFTMLARDPHLPRRNHPGHPATTPASASASASGPAERHFPVATVGGHGLLAVITLILVLLSALEFSG